VTNRRGMLRRRCNDVGVGDSGLLEGEAHETRGWGWLLGLGGWRLTGAYAGRRRWAKAARDWVRSSRVGSVILGRGGGGGVSLGAGRETGVAADVDVVGQAGSEQVGRAARSHNMSEGHVDSIKEGRLWRGRLSRDA
jgi:hypothetical protein